MYEQIKKLVEQVDYIEDNITDDPSGEVQDTYFEVKDEINSLFQIAEGRNLSILKNQYKRLTDIGKDCGFDDPEGDLDAMFPDRHDEDFDEDSMSYDSVFGDD